MAPGHGDDLEIKSYQGGRVMYGLSGSLVQFGSKRPKKKPGRKSDYSKFLEKQRDLFPVDLYTANLTSSFSSRLSVDADLSADMADAPPQAAASARAASHAEAPHQSCKKSIGFDLEFFDLRRCSTADQSGVPDFGDFRDGH